MQINLESSDIHTITSYSDSQITVNNTAYNDSLIISRQVIISPWPVHSVVELSEDLLKPILELQPEVIIIGHNQLGVQVPIMLVQYLANQRIGVECMSIGAASRTFNVLLGEQRNVVLGVILDFAFFNVRHNIKPE